MFDNAGLAPADIRAALAAAVRFWDALANDEDELVVQLLPADALDFLGAEPGVAGRLRNRLEITQRDCLRLGHLSQVAVLPGQRVRPAFTIADEARPYHPGELMVGWRVELKRSEGSWLVDPIRAHDAPAIATFDLDTDRFTGPGGGAG